MSTSAGELVNENFDYDGRQQVTAHVPAEQPQAVVFAGDGQLISQWGDWADALGDAGSDVVMTERTGNHGDPFWRDEFPLTAAWAIGR